MRNYNHLRSAPTNHPPMSDDVRRDSRCQIIGNRPKNKEMTNTKFIYLCGVHTIDPAIAIEHPDIIAALENRDDDEVERLLLEEF